MSSVVVTRKPKCSRNNGRASKRRLPLGLWIARDGDGSLWLFSGQPQLTRKSFRNEPLAAPQWVPGAKGRCLGALEPDKGDDTFPELDVNRCQQLVPV